MVKHRAHGLPMDPLSMVLKSVPKNMRAQVKRSLWKNKKQKKSQNPYSEAAMQMRHITSAEKKYPGIYITSTGQHLGGHQAGYARNNGDKPGKFDLLIIRSDGKILWQELKRTNVLNLHGVQIQKPGYLSDLQNKFGYNMKRKKTSAVVSWGFRQAQDDLDRFMKLPFDKFIEWEPRSSNQHKPVVVNY